MQNIVKCRKSRFNRKRTGLITNASRIKKYSNLSQSGFTLLTVTDILIGQLFSQLVSIKIQQKLVPCVKYHAMTALLILFFTPNESQPMSTLLPACAASDFFTAPWQTVNYFKINIVAILRTEEKSRSSSNKGSST